jgi:phosphotriesterase-related protein
MTVETVSGPVAWDDLGRTLMHEHVFVIDSEALQNWGHVFGPLYWDERERVDDAITKLARVREAGIRTIVDPTALASAATSLACGRSRRRPACR